MRGMRLTSASFEIYFEANRDISMFPTDHRNGNVCERKSPAVLGAIRPRSEQGQLGELPGASASPSQNHPPTTLPPFNGYCGLTNFLGAETTTGILKSFNENTPCQLPPHAPSILLWTFLSKGQILIAFIAGRITVAVFLDVLVEFDKYILRTNPNNNLMMRRAGLSKSTKKSFFSNYFPKRRGGGLG